MSSTHVLWCTYTYTRTGVCAPHLHTYMIYVCWSGGRGLWPIPFDKPLRISPHLHIQKAQLISEPSLQSQSQSVWVLCSAFCSFMVKGHQFVEIYFRCNIQKWVANHKEGRILFSWTSSCNRKSQWGPKNAKPHLTQFSTHFPPTHAFFLQMTCWSTALLSTTPGHSLVHCQASCLMTLLMHCETSPFLWLLQCEHILVY